jgi:hypothetical protein
MARHRSFSSEFKRQISREFLERRAGNELARRYNLPSNAGGEPPDAAAVLAPCWRRSALCRHRPARQPVAPDSFELTVGEGRWASACEHR